MDIGDYPIDESSLDPNEEIKQLDRVRPTSMSELSMRLRDIFWAGVTVESDIVCPQNRDAQLRILVDPPSDAIVLSCDACGWGQTPQGQEWDVEPRLKPVTKYRLERWRQTGG